MARLRLPLRDLCPAPSIPVHTTVTSTSVQAEFRQGCHSVELPFLTKDSMIFGPVTSQVATIFGGLCWPAYQSFKATSLGSNEPLREWLIYWTVLAVFLIFQWVGDLTIFWLPLYYDAKVALVLMLWHPKVKGAAYIYNQYLQPILRSQEAVIDRNLAEAKTRVLDYCNGHIHRAKEYALTHTSTIVGQLKSFSEQTPPAMGEPQPAPGPHLHTD